MFLFLTLFIIDFDFFFLFAIDAGEGLTTSDKPTDDEGFEQDQPKIIEPPKDSNTPLMNVPDIRKYEQADLKNKSAEDVAEEGNKKDQTAALSRDKQRPPVVGDNPDDRTRRRTMPAPHGVHTDRTDSNADGNADGSNSDGNSENTEKYYSARDSSSRIHATTTTGENKDTKRKETEESGETEKTNNDNSKRARKHQEEAKKITT